MLVSVYGGDSLLFRLFNGSFKSILCITGITSFDVTHLLTGRIERRILSADGGGVELPDSC